MAFYEHHKRSIVKSISFRILVMFSDFTIVFLLTHRYDIALGLIILTNLSSTILYYLHERVWNVFNWGKA